MAHMKPVPAKPLSLPATVTEWRLYARIGKLTFDNLPPECQPRTARFGTKVLVVEAPNDWATRVAAYQMKPPRRAKRAAPADAENQISREAA